MTNIFVRKTTFHTSWTVVTCSQEKYIFPSQPLNVFEKGTQSKCLLTKPHGYRLKTHLRCDVHEHHKKNSTKYMWRGINCASQATRENRNRETVKSAADLRSIKRNKLRADGTETNPCKQDRAGLPAVKVTEEAVCRTSPLD